MFYDLSIWWSLNILRDSLKQGQKQRGSDYLNKLRRFTRQETD